MTVSEFKKWTEKEHETWRKLYSRLDRCRERQAVPEFAEGLKVLGIGPDAIPNMEQVNQKLASISGWRGVPVTGFVEVADFFAGLTRKEFPIGNFIRDDMDLSYTPAPDVFHDLYGHLPLFVDRAYGDFCQKFGEVACRYAGNEEVLKQFDRLFWFGVEFPLLRTAEGVRIFGGGILSSLGESDYSLSDKPKVESFDVERIRHQDFHIDVFQDTLFLLDSKEQLFSCLRAFEAGITA